jgi:preprotein translocase subunit SecB
MADNDGDVAATPAAAAEAQQPVFRIQRVYLKDVSFESPQTPQVFIGNKGWKPNVALHLNTESSRLENDLFECVLVVTATVSVDEETVYLCEVKQAGLFTMKGFAEPELAKMLGSFCPNVLFPFAREEIGSLVQKGGFPQLLLEPVNFDALYAQHLQQARQNAPAPETPQ